MDQNTLSIEGILAAAVEIASPEERQDYVQLACAGDDALRKKIERMIANYFRAGDLLERCPALPATVDYPCKLGMIGANIGNYKLLEQIGEGGMGLVYVAEQHEPVRRRVALKIIKPGMDSRQVIARFEAERQALAMMDHANIARVFDGGTTPEGRLYFVMELVRGTPITDYCDTHRFNTRQRLKLFLDVCNAVQHAHQKGIIHRDLKPTNILVSHHDTTPVVKVIDFGIAKAISGQLTDKTVYTAFAQMVGTPLYMSPEQAGLSDLDVDTRSDVYSLGVLLYELLTGTTPFTRETLQKASYDEIRRMIREEEPPRPSARLSTLQEARLSTIAVQRGLESHRLSQHVRGELDWIAMRAIEKDRNRRYETASAFAADIQRYLNDEAVDACPPSMSYQLQKFVRRNRRWLASSVAVAAILLIATVVSVWQAVRAENALQQSESDRLQAEAEKIHATQAQQEADGARTRIETAYAEELRLRKRTREIMNTMYTDVAERLLPRVRGMSGLRQDFLRKALSFYEEERAEVPTDPETRLGAIWANARVGHIQWMLNDFEKSLRAYNRAVTMADAFQAEDPGQSERRATLGHILFQRNLVQPTLDLRITDLERGLAIFEQLAASNPCNNEYRKSQARHLSDLGLLAKRDREEYCRRGLKVAEQLLTDFSKDIENMDEVGHACHCLGSLLSDRGIKLEEAEQLLDRALMIFLDQFSGPNAHPQGLFFLSMTLAHLGNVRALRDPRDPRADEHFAESRSIFLRLETDFPGVFWYGLSIISRIHIKRGRASEALDFANQVVRLKPNEAEAHYTLGHILTELRRHAEAVECLNKAIELKPDYFNAHFEMGYAYSENGKFDHAIIAYRKAIELNPDHAQAHYNLGAAYFKKGKLEETVAECKESLRLNAQYAPAYNLLGVVFREQGKLDEAVASYRKSLELGPNQPHVYLNLGRVLEEMDKLDQAIDEYKQLIRTRPRFGDVHLRLGKALLKKGKADEAIASFHEAMRLAPMSVEVLNDLAWLLATCSDVKFRDPPQAVKQAQKAVLLAPDAASIRNTLGVAQYRNSNWKAAIEALTTSIKLSKGGSSADFFFLAMAHWQLNEKDKAREWYDQGVAWMEMNNPKNEELKRFREEAAKLLGIKTTEPAMKPKNPGDKVLKEPAK